MNELNFSFEDKVIQVIQKENDTWFLAKDVCEVLEIKNTSDAMSRLDEDEKGVVSTDTLGGKQNMNIINESGLYSLILTSRKPEAKRFKKWVTSEVLPSIRKNGAYMTENTLEKVISDPNFMIGLLTNLKEEQQKRKELEVLVDEQKPKVLFAAAVEASKSSILIGELAKVLKQNGIDIGPNKLFSWLRSNGYLMNRGESYNQPTQRSMNKEWFELKKSNVINPDGSIRVTTTTKVTGKGQIYFVNLFLDNK